MSWSDRDGEEEFWPLASVFRIGCMWFGWASKLNTLHSQVILTITEKKKLNFDQPNSEYMLNTEPFLEKFFDHRHVLKPNQNM